MLFSIVAEATPDVLPAFLDTNHFRKAIARALRDRSYDTAETSVVIKVVCYPWHKADPGVTKRARRRRSVSLRVLDGSAHVGPCIALDAWLCHESFVNATSSQERGRLIVAAVIRAIEIALAGSSHFDHRRLIDELRAAVEEIAVQRPTA